MDLSDQVTQFILSDCCNAPVGRTPAYGLEPSTLTLSVWCTTCWSLLGAPGIEDLKDSP